MTIPSLPAGYSVRFADEGHQPITNWIEFGKRCGYTTLGLYYENVLIGTGALEGRNGRIQRIVCTHAMALRTPFRKQGHGVWLYLAMLHAAQQLGADVIYSSYNLNKYSRRMWSVKLADLFKVHRNGGCPHCARRSRYFIRFKENK